MFRRDQFVLCVFFSVDHVDHYYYYQIFFLPLEIQKRLMTHD